MENQMMVLPAEVAQIAENVSVEKRNEVQTVLNHVFNGVAKMREQLDSVVVVDENDNVNMKLASTIRLGVKNMRLGAEKTFDAKRAEVQAQMMSYKTEDALWLKAKQTMQILTKEIEETARWKEETAKRFEAEQKELKIQQRILKVQKVAPEMLRSEFENISDETFEMFFAGIEKAYNDKIEAERKAEEERIEKEKIDRLHNERKNQLLDVWQFVPEVAKTVCFGSMADNSWASLVAEINEVKAVHDAKIEAQRIETERLRKEAEEKQKQIEAERAKADADRKAAEGKARKEREDADRKLKAEQAAKQKLEAELKAKADAEAKQKADAEKAAKLAAAAPDKEKIIAAVNAIEFNLPACKSEKMQQIANDISQKFESFKKWAIAQTETL